MSRDQDVFASQRASEPEYAPDLEDDDLHYRADTWTDGEVSSPEPDDPLAFADPDLIKLGLTLDFGPGDLAANQEGVLSPAQIAQLEMDLRWFYWSMIPPLVILALVISLLGITSGTLTLLLPALLVLSLTLIPALLYRREVIRLPQRTVKHTLLRMGGFALTMRRWGLSADDKWPVEGDKYVFGPKHLYKVLRANQTYLAYYTPVQTWKPYRLLSLEPLDDAGEKPKRKAKPKR